MATATQTLPLSCTPSRRFRDPYPAQPPPLLSHCTMGSVGSLVERPEVSPERLKSGRAGPQAGARQQDGPLRKGFTQRELLNYLNIAKKEQKPGGKHIISSISSIKREHGREEENVYSKVYHKDARELDLGKNSLPIGGKYEKSRFRPSAFKPVTPKTFSSVQNLYPSKSEDLDSGLSNGLQVTFAKVASAGVSTSSSSSSPSRHAAGGVAKAPLAAARGLSQEDESMSDSGHNSMNSLPPYRPPFRPHLGQISASMGHIDHIGSLDRASASTATEGSCPGGMPALGRLRVYGSEAPPPYELSQSLEDVVRDLEDRLLEKEHELKQMRRNLDESEGAIAQVFEGKQRLWEKEVEELRRLYAAKLRQVSQHAQRSTRSLQLQLYKVQQERRRLQDDLEALQNRTPGGHAQEPHPQLEETQWEVCQKSGEISLLKQQVRDAQAEVAQKLSEIFHLKTQLREARGEGRAKDAQIQLLQQALQGEGPGGGAEARGTGPGGGAEERLRAELLLERRQSEAQASAFEAERRTWQAEKDKVIRYQKELQASYLDMFHRNQALERELAELRGGAEGGEGGGAGDGEAEGGDRLPPGLPWIDRIESSEI
ncbi:NEDD4-binding protein 3-A [Anguilla rostrata]|uniref:NEDD4-binding protein 3-A n=1 Tax=Anguilla rostrata TaxID=7938 RepID=UPI0030CB2D58